jgi:hypothetical protein
MARDDGGVVHRLVLSAWFGFACRSCLVFGVVELGKEPARGAHRRGGSHLGELGLPTMFAADAVLLRGWMPAAGIGGALEPGGHAAASGSRASQV